MFARLSLFWALFLFQAILPVSNADAERIRLAQFGQAKFLFYLPLYVAMEEGYFAKNGLEIELSFAGNDDQVFASLVSGSADFAVGDPIFAAIAAERKFKAKVVALVAQRLAIFGYTKNPKIAPLRRIQDLVGLRIGSFPAPSTTYTFLKDLKAKLGDQRSFDIVEGGQGTQWPMLEANKVDIAIDLEPAASIAEEKGARVVFAMTDFSARQAITGVMTTQAMITNKPEIVQRFVTSLQQALSALEAEPAVGVRTAEKLFPDVSSEVLRRAVGRLLAADCYPSSVVISDQDWQRSIASRIKSGDLSKEQATNEAVDNEFAKNAQIDTRN